MGANASDIVISVKEEYLAKMLSREKTIELRRKKVNIAPGSRVWFYVKAPTAHIGAYASVVRVVTGTPNSIWSKYRSQVGITAKEFDAYFKGSPTGCAIFLKNVQPVAPAVGLSDLRSRLKGFHPPQFFKRLHKDSPELLLLRSHLA